MTVTTVAPMTTPYPIDPAVAAELRKAGAKVREWTERRDEIITAAVAAGSPLRAVGDAVGLTHTAVRNIANGRPDRG